MRDLKSEDNRWNLDEQNIRANTNGKSNCVLYKMMETHPDSRERCLHPLFQQSTSICPDFTENCYFLLCDCNIM